MTSPSFKHLNSLVNKESLKDANILIGIPSSSDLSLFIMASGALKASTDMTRSTLILTKGTVDNDGLQLILEQAFPNKKISNRHGGHYLCMARSGKIKNIPSEYIPLKQDNRKAISLSQVTAYYNRLSTEDQQLFVKMVTPVPVKKKAIKK